MKIAMYTRVSTHHQIDKDSLPLQKQDLINYAKFALNCEDYEIFEDAGFSAKNTDRPEYQKMMNKIRKANRDIKVLNLLRKSYYFMKII